jgi:hypothetical protein
MENLSPDSLPAVILLICLVFAVGLAIFWKSSKALIRRRAARAMKRGNETYRKWRKDTVRQPLQ